MTATPGPTVISLSWTVPVEHHAAALQALQALPAPPWRAEMRRKDNEIWDELYRVSDWNAEVDDEGGMYLTGLDGHLGFDRNLDALRALAPFSVEGSFVRLATISPDDPDMERGLEGYRVTDGQLRGQVGVVTWRDSGDFSRSAQTILDELFGDPVAQLDHIQAGLRPEATR